MTFADAQRRPFETIESGPAAGAVGAAELCRRLGVRFGVAADVGGTSFDACLIEDGRPAMAYEGRIAGMVVQAPWVDVRSIGAGGGSIAFVDEEGLLQVGPESAGSDPGPACYGLGGVRPTVTDAAAALGMGRFQTMRMVILPQAVRMIIPAIGNQFMAMQKDASLVSIMGVWEVTYRANRVARIDSMYLEMFLVAAAIYWILTLVSEWLQGRLEQRMARSDR